MNYLGSDLSLLPVSVEQLTGVLFGVKIAGRSVVLSVSHADGHVTVHDGVGVLGVYDEETFSQWDLAVAACCSLAIPATIVPSDDEPGG